MSCSRCIRCGYLALSAFLPNRVMERDRGRFAARISILWFAFSVLWERIRRGPDLLDDLRRHILLEVQRGNSSTDNQPGHVFYISNIAALSSASSNFVDRGLPAVSLLQRKPNSFHLPNGLAAFFSSPADGFELVA